MHSLIDTTFTRMNRYTLHSMFSKFQDNLFYAQGMIQCLMSMSCVLSCAIICTNALIKYWHIHRFFVKSGVNCVVCMFGWVRAALLWSQPCRRSRPVPAFNQPTLKHIFRIVYLFFLGRRVGIFVPFSSAVFPDASWLTGFELGALGKLKWYNVILFFHRLLILLYIQFNI